MADSRIAIIGAGPTGIEAALAAHNAEQAPPAWPAQLSAAVNLDKDLSQPDAPDDEFIYWSN